MTKLEFAQHIKSLRSTCFSNRHDFALASGIYINTIKNYESGKTMPGIEYIVKLSQITLSPLAPLIGLMLSTVENIDSTDVASVITLIDQSVSEKVERSDKQSSLVVTDRASAIQLIQNLASQLVNEDTVDISFIANGVKHSRHLEGVARISVAAVATNIAMYRAMAGLTQLELGAKCGWSQSRLANYEAELREPSLDDIQHIANVLGIPVTKIMGL